MGHVVSRPIKIESNNFNVFVDLHETTPKDVKVYEQLNTILFFVSIYK